MYVCSSCTVTLMLGTTESQLTSSRWLLPLEVPPESTHITCSLVVDAVKRTLFCSGLHLLSSFHHFKFTCFLQELTRQFWPLFDIATDTLSNIWNLFFLWVGQKNCLIFIIYSTKVLKKHLKVNEILEFPQEGTTFGNCLWWEQCWMNENKIIN